MKNDGVDADVLIIGGGPCGSTLASLLGLNGYRALVIEKDVHPREHVGEAMTPSVNRILNRIGFLRKMEEAGFVHKVGVGWTAPRSPADKFLSIRTADFPLPGATQSYSYNVERDVFDALLLRHAHEQGAKVLQGVKAQKVLFEHGRAVGVRATVTDTWERDLFAPFVVDASGRRCVLANQLGIKKSDPNFKQFCIYSWFKDVDCPVGYEGYLLLHFLGLERAWAWQIPLRGGVWSIGVVADKADFKRSKSTSDEEFFFSLLRRSRPLSYNMRNARRIRPWWYEGDYSYNIETLVGPGWLLVGDALRFVDPIFSSGVDVALYSADHAFEAINAVLQGEDEERALKEYERMLSEGVDVWYQLTSLFYSLQNLFTVFAIKKETRPNFVRILQGNPYLPDSLQRAREMISLMQSTRDQVMGTPGSLLRPGALGAPASGRPRA